MSSAEYSCKLFKPIFTYKQSVWTLIWLLLQANSVDPDMTAPTGKQCGPWSDCSYWSGSTLQKCLSKSQADDKADDSCCDWQFKSLTYFICILSVTYTNNNINIQMGFENSCMSNLTSSPNKSQNSRFFCDHIRADIRWICLNCSVKDR